MADLPEPLTPADCDLRGLPFMPLKIIQVMQSETFGLSTGDEFKAAFALWCASWMEVPAASLPADDRMLDFLSRSKAWKKVKAVALRGWVLCSDGRLYHPVVAGNALEAWEKRTDYRDKEGSKNDRQQRWRDQCKQLSAQLRDFGITPPKGASLEKLRSLLEAQGVDGETSTSVDGEASTVDAGEIGKTETVKRQLTTTPIPPDGGNAQPEAKPAKVGAIALQTFLADCEVKGERPLRAYAPLWAYAKEAGLESGFVALAWAEFRRRFTPGGPQPEKRQKDWRATFRKYVENNYFKLWAIDKDGKYFLTSLGKQAQKVHETREAA